MSSRLNSSRFDCRWHFSKYALISFVMLYSFSLIVILGLSWCFELKALVILVLSCYWIAHCIKWVLFKVSSSFTALRKQSNAWFIYSAEKGWQAITLSTNGCLILSWVIILQFTVEQSKRVRTLTLLIDSMPTEDFRRLRIYLRYGR